MELDFRDAISGMPCPKPTDGTYSIVSLHREHKERYVLMTKAGAIILRRMPLRLHRLIQSQRLQASRHIGEIVAEFQDLAKRVEGMDEADIPAEDRKRINEIADQLAFSDYSALGVIESPQILTMDDYDDLLSQLDEDERSLLYLAVQEMATIKDEAEIDSTEQAIADRLGVKIIDESMFGLMTVSQASFWASRIARENEEIRRQNQMLYGGR